MPVLSQSTTAPAELKDRYIVELKADLVRTKSATDAIARSYSRRVRHVYGTALKGFAADIDSVQLEALRRDPRVQSVQRDVSGVDNATDTNAGWGVGRIDQRIGPSDNQFTSNFTGQGVNIYIVDGGINTAHPDFGGRAFAAATWDASFPANQDCTGHGTQVASVAAGTEYGVAKGATLRSVRVNGCGGGGSVGDWIWGIDWVAANRQLPAVLSFSKSTGDFLQSVYHFGALNTAIRGAKNAGMLVVVAAGNKNGDACGYSPSEVLEVLVVAASDQSDNRAIFTDPNQPGSNFGWCVDLFAPGLSLNVALAGGGVGTASGTSLSAPMVAGVGALLLQQYPSDTPDQIQTAILDGATSGAVGYVDPYTTRRLVYSTLPAPVSVSIVGPSSLGKFASCAWNAVTKAGRPPFSYSWSGILSGTGATILGNPPASGFLNVQVSDGLGNVASSSKYVTETNSLSLFCN